MDDKAICLERNFDPHEVLPYSDNKALARQGKG